MTPQLLHNTGGGPRSTRVSTFLRPAFLRPVGGMLAVFQAGADDQELLRSEAGRERIEEAWLEAGLRGAALVFALPTGGTVELETVPANGPLSLNVLGRARAGLLLPGTPLATDEAHIGRVLASDDPRLVALAIASAGRPR